MWVCCYWWEFVRYCWLISRQIQSVYIHWSWTVHRSYHVLLFVPSLSGWITYRYKMKSFSFILKTYFPLIVKKKIIIILVPVIRIFDDNFRTHHRYQNSKLLFYNILRLIHVQDLKLTLMLSEVVLFLYFIEDNMHLQCWIIQWKWHRPLLVKLSALAQPLHVGKQRVLNLVLCKHPEAIV